MESHMDPSDSKSLISSSHAGQLWSLIGPNRNPICVTNSDGKPVCLVEEGEVQLLQVERLTLPDGEGHGWKVL
jgi:hypothetical protein